MTEKTVDEVKAEVLALVDSLVGKINQFDSKHDMTETTMTVLNDVVAKVNLSKVEKAGCIAYLTVRRIRD